MPQDPPPADDRAPGGPPDAAPAVGEADRQRLVAYLDGELPAGEARGVESEIASNDTLRVELERLEKVWNALDALPRPEAGAAFTKSTVRLVAADARREVERLTAVLPVRRRRRRWGVVAACLAAMLAGAVLARGVAGRHDRRVLANLPVLYQYDVLGQFNEPAYLRRLRDDAPGLVNEFRAGDYQGVAVEQRAADWRTLIDGSAHERAEWVARQPDAEKLRLQRAAKRYTDTPAEAHASAATLLADIASQPDADELLATAVAYQAWLATLPATTQSELRQIDDPRKRAGRARRRYESGRTRAASELTAADAEALRSAVRGLTGDLPFTRLRGFLIKNAGQKVEPRMRWAKRVAERIETVPAWRVALLADLAGARRGRMTKELANKAPEAHRAAVAYARREWPRIEERLTSGLAEATRDRLAALPRAERIEQLRAWVIEAGKAAVRPDDATLEEYFASAAFTDTERAELLALSMDEMRRELEQRYVGEEFGVAPLQPPKGKRGSQPGGRKADGRKNGGRKPGPRQRPETAPPGRNPP